MEHIGDTGHRQVSRFHWREQLARDPHRGLQARVRPGMPPANTATQKPHAPYVFTKQFSDRAD